MTTSPVVTGAGQGCITTTADVEDYLLRELSPSGLNPFTGGRGIERTAALLRELGAPQDRLRVVHVAGTAGKGSVSAFLTGLLTTHGHRVGTYLSPHAHSVLERFLIDGRPAEIPRLGSALEAVREAAVRSASAHLGDITMFEAATAAAYLLFRDQAVDYAVMETGLGGLRDATNTVSRSDKLAVLTAIGYDHTAVLGTTLGEIAAQKAGILPLRGTAIALRGAPEVDRAIEKCAARRRCTVHRVDERAADELTGMALGLPGAHQRVNAALALRAARELAHRDGWRLEPQRVAEGLRQVRLPGRFERRSRHGRPLVLDGAHNAMKLAGLAATVREEYPGPLPVWVLALKPDKDTAAALRAVVPHACAIVATTFGAAGDAVPASVLAVAARDAGARRVATACGPAAALDLAAELAPIGVPIVVSGSFSLVAEVGSSIP